MWEKRWESSPEVLRGRYIYQYLVVPFSLGREGIGTHVAKQVDR